MDDTLRAIDLSLTVDNYMLLLTEIEPGLRGAWPVAAELHTIAERCILRWDNRCTEYRAIL